MDKKEIQEKASKFKGYFEKPIDKMSKRQLQVAFNTVLSIKDDERQVKPNEKRAAELEELSTFIGALISLKK